MARWEQANERAIPDWFWKAVETAARHRAVEVDECDVCYQVWGDAARPGMLLVHGMNAHRRWWDFIGPQLADDYQVAAMDLTGMGDSDYRYAYDSDTYAREIVAVCDDAGFDPRVVVVGHSFGGVMAVKAANRFPQRFGALVLVDSGMRHPEEPEPDHPLLGGGRAKAYPDRETAEARFRLYPPQPCDNDYILRYIAKHSLMRLDGGGWAWKFDEELPLTLKDAERRAEDYAALRVPTGIVHGAESESFTAQTLAHTLALIPGEVPVAEVANARHHVFLDQPLAFVQALREVVGKLRG